MLATAVLFLLVLLPAQAQVRQCICTATGGGVCEVAALTGGELCSSYCPFVGGSFSLSEPTIAALALHGALYDIVSSPATPCDSARLCCLFVGQEFNFTRVSATVTAVTVPVTGNCSGLTTVTATANEATLRGVAFGQLLGGNFTVTLISAGDILQFSGVLAGLAENTPSPNCFSTTRTVTTSPAAASGISPVLAFVLWTVAVAVMVY